MSLTSRLFNNVARPVGKSFVHFYILSENEEKWPSHFGEGKTLGEDNFE
jgi:hypothetical protein